MIYAQCENFGQFECNSDQNCEWGENIDSGVCSDFDYNSALCDSINQCDWTSYEIDCGTATGYSDCDISAGCSYSWLTYTCSGWTTVSDCSGGYYEIDNGYCQEIEMPECSEMLEGQCDDNEDCEWVEDIANMSCSGFTIETCNMQDGCFLDQDCEQWGSWYSWICYDYGPLYCSGSYESDNSYCEEISVEYLMGDINNDFIINILDVIEIINLILNDEHIEMADMNHDHSVDVLDIIVLVDIILNGEGL